MTAYYNEYDSKAAAWLRELIKQGHIAPGIVDERSIEDVKPSELTEFTQCHFFAGIGVWSYALRQAGWPDDRRVWTGSCPCQPFSAAGKGSGFSDERHLWPAWFHLIQHGKADDVPIFGEQVASKDGLAWLDLVQADMEGANYACWPVDICAAGVGAPHVRQRLFFYAERMGNTNGSRLQGHRELGEQPVSQERGRTERHSATAGELVGVANSSGVCWDKRFELEGNGRSEHPKQNEVGGGDDRYGSTSPTNGFWRDVDWLFCRDEKWRPVEPSTFPLANGITARVGRLRGYGNAINAEVAKTFIEVVMGV